MRYSTRVILVMMIAGILPLLIIILISERTIASVQANITNSLSDDLRKAGEMSVHAQAEEVARSIEQYLEFHPEIPTSTTTIIADPVLANIATAAFGQTGFTFVFNQEGTILFYNDPALVNQNIQFLPQTENRLTSILQLSLNGNTNEGSYNLILPDGRVQQRFIAIAAADHTHYLVAAVVDEQEFTKTETMIQADISQARQSNRVPTYVGYGLIVLLTGLAIAWAGNDLAAPIKWMTSTAHSVLRVMQGMFKNIPLPTRSDEISVIGHTLGIMEGQVREEFSNLEKQIALRTGELKQRTTQLEIAAQVAREAADIHDMKRLLDQAVRLISDRFGFYHVGIFLLDKAGEFAILQAANSEGGRRMLERAHMLRIGKVGIVGHVAQSGEVRVVSDVGANSEYQPNPDLTYTHSEAALPLQTRGKVIGVLDVQSTQVNAFSQETINILQILADQIALAIENARLLEESQNSLREIETLFGSQSQRAWAQRIGRKTISYLYNRLSVVPTTTSLPLQATAVTRGIVTQENGNSEIIAPLLLRGNSIGSLVLRRGAEQDPWNEDDLRIVEESITQIVSALENARLLEEIRDYARQEALVGQVSAHIQAAHTVEEVLQAAAEQIGPAVGAAKVRIRLRATSPDAVDAIGASPDSDQPPMASQE